MSDHLLTDLKIEVIHKELRPVYRNATQVRNLPRNELGGGPTQDLATVTGEDNLAQAVIMRLLTPRGELAALGHPDYGSRLHQLIGRTNTETTRNLVKLNILESLAREPRIERVFDVTVTPHPVLPTRVDVSMRVLPVEATETVTIGPFILRLAS